MTYPKFVQLFVRWLARHVLPPEDEAVGHTQRSQLVSDRLKLNTLWATGVRVWHKFGRHELEESAEMAEFYAALNEVKPVPFYDHEVPS